MARVGNPLVEINNQAVAIVPNSVKYTEGEGETITETQMVGNTPELVTSSSGEDKMSSFTIEFKNTEANIKLLRGIKKNPGKNVVAMSEGSFNRTFQQASLVNDYEAELSATGKLTTEWKSLPAI